MESIIKGFFFFFHKSILENLEMEKMNLNKKFIKMIFFGFVKKYDISKFFFFKGKLSNSFFQLFNQPI